MKKENINISGIRINDSITMSVKNKRKNFREFEALLIALCGYIGIIAFFLSTFIIPYDRQSIILFSSVFAVIYGISATVRGKASWVFPASFAVMGIGIYRYYSQIKTGFCLVFNIMYKKFTDTGINYFKSVNPLHSEQNITIFLIFAVWLLSAVVFIFTVYRPNILVIVAVTFPIVEICLYYGIEVPVIWTSLVMGYWFAVLSVCSSDLGEYFRGGRGFTRKDDVFFPKRRMKFKVTEKCGLSVIAATLVVAFIANTIIEVTGYERNEKIKEQRRELKTAVNSFSVENLASSISDITESLGFSFEYQDNRLGKLSKVSYKGKTDLVITLDDIPSSAIYLKGFTASEYGENEWIAPDYDNYKDINSMFEKYDIYPQEFIFNSHLSDESVNRIKITSKKKNHKFYIPYGIIKDESFSFENDDYIKRERGKDYSFEFCSVGIQDISEKLNLLDISVDLDYYHEFTDEQNQTIINFCEEYQNNMLVSNIQNLAVLTDYDSMMNMLVENQYRKFVYENYLKYPDNEDFREIYKEYSDILDNASVSTAQEKLDTLKKLKDKMNSDVEYTLEPGKTPSTRDFTNYFLLENKKGYCVHYATAGVMLARMAGIPARYATGYVSVVDDYNDDSRNPDDSYTVKLADNRSHAWAEIYLDGYGWIPFEFTAGYSDLSIASENPEEAVTTSATTETTTTSTGTAVVSSSLSSSVTKNITEYLENLKSSVISSSSVTEITVSTVTSHNTYFNSGFNFFGINSEFKKIFAVIAVLLLIFARRWIIIGVRRKRLNSGKARKRVLNNYRYVMRLLKYMGIKQKNLQYNEFADSVEEQLSGIYFEKGYFTAFSGIVLKSVFGNSAPNDSELDFLSEFSRKFSGNICKKSNIFVRLYLRLFSVLI